MVHAWLKPSTGPLGRKLTFTCKRKCTADNYYAYKMLLLNGYSNDILVFGEIGSFGISDRIPIKCIIFVEILYSNN